MALTSATVGESSAETVEIPHRYDFEEIKTIPQNWRRDLAQRGKLWKLLFLSEGKN